MKSILIIGAPGSGKGTQACNIVRDFGLSHVSTGDLLRSSVNAGSELGKRVESILQLGQLVDDDTMLALIHEELNEITSENDQGFLLDGYPRTLNQALSLDSMLFTNFSLEISAAIYLKVPDEIIIERITGRRLAPNSGKVYHVKYNPPKKAGYCDISGEKLVQRPDDTPETVLKRLKVFHESTEAILPLYEEKNVLHMVNGALTPQEVYSKIYEIINDIS